MALVALLCFYSLHLALNRIYQVDEAQNAFMARILGKGAWDRYYSHAGIWLLGPLAWLARAAETSEELFTWLRLVFVFVYWINVILLVFAAGGRPRTRNYWPMLLMASTLLPLFDYGMEIRHDNLLLTLLLLFWITVRRPAPFDWRRYLFFGLLSGVMQLVAFKAFLFWVPLSLLLVAFPPVGGVTVWWKRAGGWVAGLVLALSLAALIYTITGTWSALREGFRQAAEGATTGEGRFAPWMTLQRLALQMPLVLAGAFAVLLSLVVDLRKPGGRRFEWNGAHPEACLFLLTLLAFLINPVPYPYNLVAVAPFALLLTARGFLSSGAPGFFRRLLEESGGVYFTSLLVFTHLLLFGFGAARHLDFSNARQHLLMATAERMTDPERDRIFDASGLVACRWPATRPWFLHSISVGRLQDGRQESMRSQLQRFPAAVFIPSYRTDWLPKEDQEWIRSHYRPLADDFWVLGTLLPTGGGTFTCLLEGRYFLSAGPGPRVNTPPETALLDGNSADLPGVVTLSVGLHTIRSGSTGMPVAVTWLGPTLVKPPQLVNRNHLNLFMNWY